MMRNPRRRLLRVVIPKFPTFNVYSNTARKITALGPVCVATVVSRLPGWDAEVIDENNYRYPGPMTRDGMPDHVALQQLRPADVVGFYGGLSCTVPRVFELARWYQGQGVLTLGGGQHLDVRPEEALRSGLEVVVHGEAEESIAELLTAWAAGSSLEDVPGLSLSRDRAAVRTATRPPITDFDALPLPDFGLLRFARLVWYPVGRIRGCGERCEFCAVKGEIRCASPERLLAQMAWQAESRGARKFFVVDDQFAQDREETLRFCRLVADYQRRMQVRFFVFVQIRLEHARDAELIAAMREAGVRVLAIGFESIFDDELGSMAKRQRAAEMADLARIYRRAGFLIHGMFILGYPLRRPRPDAPPIAARVRAMRRFLREARLDTVQVLHAVPLPGTDLRARLERQGRLYPLSEIGWEYYDGNFRLVQPDASDRAEELQAAPMRVMRGSYRFFSLLTLALQVLLFPVAMLPLWSLRSRWTAWYRSWRRNVLQSAGWLLMRRWRRRFRRDAFPEKLARLSKQ